jgi:hypothetical protein
MGDNTILYLQTGDVLPKNISDRLEELAKQPQMTMEQTLEQFLIALNSNAYLSMCETSDMHNVIEVLKKQIPKKPDYEGDGYDENGSLIYDTWICPCCEEHYEVDYDNYEYCPKCGQAIDWRDTE